MRVGYRRIMAGIETKRISWLRLPTATETAETWRARRQAARENFQSINSAASSAFATANTNLVTGLGQIAATAAIKRMRAASSAQATSLVDTVA